MTATMVKIRSIPFTQLEHWHGCLRSTSVGLLLHVSCSVNATEENVGESLLQRSVNHIDSVPGTGVNHLFHAWCQYHFSCVVG